MRYKVKIIGMGPGSKDYLIPAAKQAIEEADCLLGAKRLVNSLEDLRKEKFLLEGHFKEAMAFIQKNKSRKKIAVLVSGDPGLYSFLKIVSKTLKTQEYTVLPGISALQLAFAKINQGWDDAKIISIHGRKLENLASQIKYHKKVFLFTDAQFPAPKIAAYLLAKGLGNRRAVVFENLSYPDEKILDTDLKHLSRMKGFKLNVMIVEARMPKQTQGKLFGLGIGPGDPALVTLKAKEILEKAEVIFVPKSNEDAASWARSIVDTLTPDEKKIVELTFPMTKDKRILSSYWKRAAAGIAKEVKRGKVVAFVTIGDPFIYSTYIYLLKTLRKNFPEITVETVPGISSINAASAAANIPLGEANERIAIIPAREDLEGLKNALLEFDTVVVMKVGAKLDKIILLLKQLNLLKKAILVSRVGHKDERIVTDLDSLGNKKEGYLSIIIVRKGKR